MKKTIVLIVRHSAFQLEPWFVKARARPYAVKDRGAIEKWQRLSEGEAGGKEGSTGEPTVIYDVRGRIVATISSESVHLRDVAPAVWQAVVASEVGRGGGASSTPALETTTRFQSFDCEKGYNSALLSI